MNGMDETYDFIIVGGGTAGCVLASRLSVNLPDGRNRIALIEYGPDERYNPNVVDPTLYRKALAGSALWKEYVATPQKHLAGRSTLNGSGRLISGSSGVNAGQWSRGSRADYEVWREASGDDSWSFDGLLPYFKRSENFHNKTADAAFHGFDGPISTTSTRHRYPMRDIVADAYKSCGYERNEDAFNGEPKGFSDWTENFEAVSPTQSKRQHAGYVYPLDKVHIVSNTPVKRVCFDRSPNGAPRASGVELHDGTRMEARQVILTAGALKTPQILKLSGIGPAAELKRHGIELLVDSPAVGTGLWDHLAMYTYWKLRHPEKGFGVFHPNFTTPTPGLPTDFISWASVDADGCRKAMLEDGFDETAIARQLDRTRGHICIFISYHPIALPPTGVSKVKADGGHIGAVCKMMLPTARGTVTLPQSSDATADPVIDPKYLSTATDRFMMREAARQMARIFESPALADEVAGETPPDGHGLPLATALTDAQVDERVQKGARTFYHTCGTARVGEVVDSKFLVKGVDGLRICDASVFPSPVSGATQASVYAIAELAADVVLQAAP